MKSPLRILHLEDNPSDAELIQAILETEGILCHVTRVDAQADFFAAIEQGGFDIILADYTLPSFDGLSALKISQENVRTYHSSLFLERWAKKWRLKHSKLGQRIMF